jgi:hypothetical protein
MHGPLDVKILYLFVPRDFSGGAQKDSPPKGFDLRTVENVATRYTATATLSPLLIW